MIDIKNVLKVGKERIKYRSKEGSEAYIELAASANVWAHRHPDNKTDENRIVADKYTAKSEVYLEFYNIGHTKVGVKASPIARLFGRGVSQKQLGMLEAFESELVNNGWEIYNA